MIDKIHETKTDYKLLGNYIQPVVGRNNDLGDLPLVGLSIQKKFIPSIANTIGTDMTTYRIIKRNQFAYGPVTSRNGEKITIALFEDYDEALISQAYIPFEVKDKETLLPEYLMMWFRRPEFDRYARFMSHGSAREIFAWEDMCNVLLPVPSIETQRKIVAEYKTVEDRISLNNKLIQKLEETAQAIYREWFVEGIDLENLPEGWRAGKLPDLIEVKYGKAYSHLSEGEIPLFGSGGIMGKVSHALYTKPSVLIPRKGTLSNIMFVNQPFWCVDTMFYSIFNNEINGYYAYYILKQLDFDALNQGSAVPSMTTAFLNDIDIIVPCETILEEFDYKLRKIITHKENLEKEKQKLTELKDLLLSKLATIEN